MSEDQRRRISLARAGAELVVIVVGILLALGAEAWWQQQQASRLERQYLEAMKRDVELTARAAQGALGAQEANHAEILRLGELIESQRPLPDTLVTVFPPVVVLAESMDTYRDLVASGGTTRIRSMEVRRNMARLLRSVDYVQIAERWALDLGTSMRVAVWNSPRPISRQRFSELWRVWIDMGDRVILGKRVLVEQADSALVALDRELNRN